jgi:phosphoglycolate phosphatase-like HAD superfamily hydrolase
MLYLFDIDGTLLLSGGGSSRALDRVFQQRFGVERAMEAIRPGGKTDAIIIEEVFAARLGRAPTAAELDEVIALYLPLLRAELGGEAPNFRLMPSVVEALDFLAALVPGVILGLATGNVREAARIKLERAGLWPRFAVGGFGCDHRDRPRLVARAIERACEHAGVAALAPEEIVVIGDTPFDVEAARACGVRAVAVATGTATRADLAACAPDALLGTLAELPAWHAREFAAGLVA